MDTIKRTSPSSNTECTDSTIINTDKDSETDYRELQQQIIANFEKPNLPNINVPEKIIICLDVCYDNSDAVFRLGDGSTYTSMNMLKRVLDFFIQSKQAINKRSEYALLIIKDTIPCYIQNFTNNIKEIMNAIDCVNPEESQSENFDFHHVFKIIKEEVQIPQYDKTVCIIPPPFIVRMIVLYARSNCIPLIAEDDPYLIFLKRHLYFTIDILFAHEEECALNKCEEVYYALQNLDNGYSYVFEVSRNATKIHDCVAKLLAHPLQRPLQKNTDYSFGLRY